VEGGSAGARFAGCLPSPGSAGSERCRACSSSANYGRRVALARIFSSKRSTIRSPRVTVFANAGRRGAGLVRCISSSVSRSPARTAVARQHFEDKTPSAYRSNAPGCSRAHCSGDMYSGAEDRALAPAWIVASAANPKSRSHESLRPPRCVSRMCRFQVAMHDANRARERALRPSARDRRRVQRIGPCASSVESGCRQVLHD